MPHEIVYFVRPYRIENFEETFTAVAAVGIPSVVLARQMGDVNVREPAGVAKAKKILADLGLITPAIHGLHGEGCDPNMADDSPRSEMINAHIRFLEHAAELGCRTYTCHPGVVKDGDNRPELWDRVRAWLDVTAPRAESLGVKIALENLNPGYLGDDAQELRDFVESYGCPSVRICYDSGHAHISEDAATALKTLSPYVVTVHLHDNDKTADSHLLPGHGTIDWPAVIELLKQCPSLKHVETEPFNEEQWDHKAIYDLYRNLVNG